METETQQLIENTVQKLLELLGFFETRISVSNHMPNVWHADIETREGAGALIGERGQGLLAVEHVLRRIFSKNIGPTLRFSLDINGYRAEQARYLRERARTAADEAKRRGTAVSFEPMSAFERRIIHVELAARGDIITESSGEGISRHVVIRPYLM